MKNNPQDFDMFMSSVGCTCVNGGKGKTLYKRFGKKLGWEDIVLYIDDFTLACDQYKVWAMRDFGNEDPAKRLIQDIQERLLTCGLVGVNLRECLARLDVCIVLDKFGFIHAYPCSLIGCKECLGTLAPEIPMHELAKELSMVLPNNLCLTVKR